MLDSPSTQTEPGMQMAPQQHTHSRMPAGTPLLAIALYCGAFILPFMDHDGVCLGVQVLWGVLRDGWLGILVVLLTHGCLVVGLGALLTERVLPRVALWCLWLGLAVCFVLNLIWFRNYSQPFFTGFYFWTACFPVTACALWEREHFPLLAKLFPALEARVQKLPRIGLLALVCFSLSWTMPATTVFGDSTMTGWQAFRNALAGSWLAWLSAATNLVAVAGLGFVLSHGCLSRTQSKVLLCAAVGSACLNSLWVVLFPDPLRLGFYLWFTSYCLLVIAAVNQRQVIGERHGQLHHSDGGWSLLSLSTLVVAICFGLPLVRAGVFAIAGSTSTQGTETARTTRVSQTEGEGENARANPPVARPQNDPDAGMNTLLGILMGLALRQEQQHYAMQRWQAQQQQQAILHSQSRRPQFPSPEYRYPPQPGGSYLSGQGGGGRGYRPPQMQQYEGTCTRCGYKTGRQATQSYRTCSQISSNGDGIKPCGGVIVWAPLGRSPMQGY